MRLVSVEHAMIIKPRSDVVEMFKANNDNVAKYKKFGIVKAKLATAGEGVTTSVNGKIETVNTAKAGDYIVENPGGEQYIISAAKFKARYVFKRAIDSKWGEYNAIGQCWAFQYKGKAFKFEAPWGEAMLVEDGDYIAVADPKNLDDIYRIEQTAFKQTYKKA